jgi:hypothetical protein
MNTLAAGGSVIAGTLPMTMAVGKTIPSFERLPHNPTIGPGEIGVEPQLSS